MGWLNASRVEGRRGTIDQEVEPFKVVRTVEFEPDLLEMQFVGGCTHVCELRQNEFETIFRPVGQTKETVVRRELASIRLDLSRDGVLAELNLPTSLKASSRSSKSGR